MLRDGTVGVGDFWVMLLLMLRGSWVCSASVDGSCIICGSFWWLLLLLRFCDIFYLFMTILFLFCFFFFFGVSFYKKKH